MHGGKHSVCIEYRCVNRVPGTFERFAKGAANKKRLGTTVLKC